MQRICQNLVETRQCGIIWKLSMTDERVFINVCVKNAVFTNFCDKYVVFTSFCDKMLYLQVFATKIMFLKYMTKTQCLA